MPHSVSLYRLLIADDDTGTRNSHACDDNTITETRRAEQDELYVESEVDMPYLDVCVGDCVGVE